MERFLLLWVRPQFIKAAAVSRAFKGHPGLCETMVHTGQHFDVKCQTYFFKNWRFQHLYITSINGGHGKMTGRMLEYLDDYGSLKNLIWF